MRGIIFDFNGTMFFDEEFQNISWRSFLQAKTGHYITDEEFQEYIHGRNNEVSLKHFISPDLSREEIEELAEEKEQCYRDLCMKSSEFRLADGLPEFLDELADRQIPMTIATASMEKNVQFFFEHLGLDRWFSYDQVALNDGTMKGKPEPDIFLRAAELIGVRPEACMVFEDAKSGIEAARRAGACRVVGVASMQEEETLRRWGATAVIRGYQDWEKLMELLED